MFVEMFNCMGNTSSITLLRLYNYIYIILFFQINKNLHLYPQALTQRLGRIINGHIDIDNRGVIFTEAFVARHKARIRGLFSAITR